MSKIKFFNLKQLIMFLAVFFLLPGIARSETSQGQFQINAGFGVFVGTQGLGAAFDFSLEPEYFVTKHNSVSFRFDVTAGKTDSVHLGGRWHYYFDLPSPKVNLYVGLGIGAIINFNGPNFGDAALPVFGWQYDLGRRFKLGSDVSFDIIFNGNNVAFATRLMPAVIKWVF